MSERLSDEDIQKIARAVVREQEDEALRLARRECISEDQVYERMRRWREAHRGG